MKEIVKDLEELKQKAEKEKWENNLNYLEEK